MTGNSYENAVNETSASAESGRLSCALCGSRDAELVLEKTIPGPAAALALRLWRCTACGLVRTEPQLSPRELEPYYREEYWGGIEPANDNWIRRDQRHRTAFLYRFLRAGSVLDVGCGPGFFLRALDPRRWDRHGIEPMAVPYREAARSLGSDRILKSELRAGGWPSETFDVITLWDSLEHVPNPRAVLQEAGRLLRPGGIVLITLPNFGSYPARRFREDWFELSLPHHLCHYTRATLTRLLEICGFRVRVMEDRAGPVNYHALKHSLLNRMTRLHGQRGGRLRYYAAKPFLHPWEWISSRWGGGSSLQVCAVALSREATGRAS